jgi:asparagine synthase (glutamine-hydrolysing)
VWHGDGPSALALMVPRLVLARSTATHLKVVLTGEGSDELLGGYPWFWIGQTLRRVASWPPAVRRLAAFTARRLGGSRAGGPLLTSLDRTGPRWYADLVAPSAGCRARS